MKNKFLYENENCFIDGYGTKRWYKKGKLHRLKGPAIEYINGGKLWYYEDEFIDCNSQEEFERIIKLKMFW